VTTLSVGSTFVDNLMQFSVPERNRVFHTGLLNSLLEQDLQITRRSFEGTMYRSQEGLAVLAEIRYESFTNLLLDNSELLEAILSKSDHQLQEFLCQPRCLHALNPDTFTEALVMSTITGWRDGCKALLNANLMAYLDDTCSGTWPSSQNLLILSADTSRLDMLQFWLSQREVHDGPLLNLIGHFEDTLSILEGDTSCIPTMDVVQLVLSHLVKQRHEIKLLMGKHGLEHCCERARTSLPDAHVVCMLYALESEGIDVPQRYWPKRMSLYHMKEMGKLNRKRLLETFEMAGFREISQENFECSIAGACSPLIYLATQLIASTDAGCLSERNLIVQWFLSRGADLKDTWPESETTALHCLAWQSSKCLESRVHMRDTDGGALIMETPWTHEDFEFLVKEEILDKCECGCSMSGCDFLSCFWKGIFEEGFYPQFLPFPLICKQSENTPLARYLKNVRLWAPDSDDNGDKNNSDDENKDEELACGVFWRILLDLTLWVEKAASTLALDQLIYGYIRLFVFSYLELRHTCCDINRIEHEDGPDYTKQPYPRYPPKELRRINEEDAHLRARLEQLVPQLITRHDAFGGKLQDFVIEVLIPTMRRTAKELKEEDKTLYAAGRRELGVIMNEDEDDTEGASSEVGVEEVNFEEESDDEY